MPGTDTYVNRSAGTRPTAQLRGFPFRPLPEQAWA